MDNNRNCLSMLILIINLEKSNYQLLIFNSYNMRLYQTTLNIELNVLFYC